jgi:hypothetical protein
MLFFLIIIQFVPSTTLTFQHSKQLFVVPFPLLNQHDSNCSEIQSYLSIQETLNHVQREYRRSTDPITIHLYPAQYFVDTVQLL